MDMNDYPTLSPSELRAYEQKARELRSQAAGELGLKLVAITARFFKRLAQVFHHSAHA